MNEDMSNLMNQINNMIKNNQIPDDVKNIISNMSNNSQNTSGTSDTSKSQDVSSNSTSSENSAIPDFDMATIMKMKRHYGLDEIKFK